MDAIGRAARQSCIHVGTGHEAIVAGQPQIVRADIPDRMVWAEDRHAERHEGVIGGEAPGAQARDLGGRVADCAVVRRTGCRLALGRAMEKAPRMPMAVRPSMAASVCFGP